MVIPVRVKSSIGSRLFIAFIAMSAITVGLGGYSVYVLSSARVFVADTYDRALMEVNFARTAALDFDRMDKEVLRRAQALDSGARRSTGASISSRPVSAKI